MDLTTKKGMQQFLTKVGNETHRDHSIYVRVAHNSIDSNVAKTAIQAYMIERIITTNLFKND
jgi:hypothetical protein